MEKITFLNHQKWFSPRGSTSIVFAKYLILLFLFTLYSARMFGQVPEFTYTNPNSFQIGSVINPLSPANTGGSVGYNLPLTETNYSVVSFVNSTTSNAPGGSPTIQLGAYLHDIEFDTEGNCYVADAENHKIRKITPSGSVTTFAGSGSAVNIDGIGSQASLRYPEYIAIDLSNNLYVVGRNGTSIRKITPDGVVTTLAVIPTAGVSGLTIDPFNNLYVAQNGTILKITPAGVVTTFLEFNGINMSVNRSTNAIVYDNVSTSLYILTNHYGGADFSIKKVSLSGVVTTFDITNSSGLTDDYFNFPNAQNICVDKYGTIYFSSRYNIFRVSPDGNITHVSTFSNTITGIGINNIGELYVCPYFDIKKIIPLGYDIAPNLPNGLNFNRLTGVISGTPSEVSPAADYTITGSNKWGSSSKIISIVVKPKTVVLNSKTVCYPFGSTVSEMNTQNSDYDLRWYETANATAHLQATSVLLPGNYYVTQSVNDVESDRMNVVIDSYPLYMESPSTGSTLASPNSLIIAKNIPGAAKYVFEVSANGFDKNYISTTRSFRLTDLGPEAANYLFGTTFNIKIKAFDANNNNLYSNANCIYTVTTPAGPQLVSPQCGTILNSFSDYLSTENVQGAVAYKFKVIGGSVNLEYESNSRQFKLSDIPNIILSSATDYNVSVALKFNNTYSAYGPACVVTTPTVSTKLLPTQCGTTLTAINSFITANSATATSYKFKVTIGGVNTEYVSAVRQFKLTDIPGFIPQYGATYQISVAVGQGGQYHSYGEACTITTPPAVYTQVQTSQCGAVISTLNTFITANSVNVATSYKFKVTGGGIDTEYVSAVRQFKLSDIPNVTINAGTTYQVSVAVGQGGIYHPYGTACTISTPLPTYTQLIALHCGASMATLDAYLTANSVATATSYKFKVSIGGIDTEYVSAVRQFKLTDIPSFTPLYGVSYQVSVAVGQGGHYHPYGPVCLVNTPYLYTKLIASHCGATLSSISSYITANAVATATNYKFKVVGGGITAEYISAVRQFKLTDIPNVIISFDTSYQISVAVEINSSYHPYGDVCTVTTPQGTQVIAAQCGTTLPLFSSYITANTVTNASSYKFRIEGNGIDTEFISPVRQFKLTELSGVAANFGATYQISVATTVNGIEYPYGNTCNITTPAPLYTQIQASQCGSMLSANNTPINANPVSAATDYKFKIVGGGLDTEYISNIPQFRLTDLTGIVINPGANYSVSVALKVNGEYHPYGTACTVTTPYISTQLISSNCNSILNAIDDVITAQANSFATSYKFSVTGTNFDAEYISSQPQFRLTDITQATVAFGQTYHVKVALLINGEYHPYGQSCTVNTPAAIYGHLHSYFCNTVLEGWSFNAEINQLATSYKVKMVINGQEIEYISPSENSFDLRDITGFQPEYGTTYEVQIAVGQNGYYHPYGPSCTITTPLYSSAHIHPVQCGEVLDVITEKIYPEEVFLATGYKFRIVNTGLDTEYSTSDNFINLAAVSGINFGNTYQISVAAMVNGEYHPYGTPCSITTPPAQLIQIGNETCNETLLAMDHLINSNALNGATSYKFKVTNDYGLDIEHVSPVFSFRLTDLPVGAVDYGQTYHIAAAAGFDSLYMPYGPACNVTTPALTNTQISASQCNGTLNSPADTINIDPVDGAVQYKVRVLGDNFSYDVVVADPYFTVPGLAYGQSYQISVAVNMGNDYHPYGAACNITTPFLFYDIIDSQCNTTLNSISSDINVGAEPGTIPVNVTGYMYKIVNGNTETNYVSSSPSFKLTDVPGLTITNGMLYQISVAVAVNGTYHPYGTACNITTPALLYTQVQSSQCGSTLINNSSYIYADPVSGATSYKWKVTGGAVDTEYISQGNNFRLTDIPSAIIGQGITYQISISVFQDGQYNPFGSVCNISTPAVYTQVQSSQCGSILSANNTPIVANQVSGASAYKFKITGPNAEIEYISNINQFSLTNVPNFSIIAGITYQIKVAVNVNGTYSPFGPECSITAPPYYTNVQTTQCGTTLNAFDDYIIASNNHLDGTYKFKVTVNGLDTEYVSLSNKFRLTDIPGTTISYNQVYQVSVALKLYGSEFYQPYGDICAISTPTAVITQLQTSQCGSILFSALDPIFANYVVQATNYKFKVIKDNTEYIFISPYRTIQLGDVPGLPILYGAAYQVSVSLEIAGQYGPYGPSCTVSTPEFVYTKIQSSQCGSTLTAFNSIITAKMVYEATQYRFNVIGGAINTEYTTTANSFRLTNLTGYSQMYGTPYQVKVAVQINGIWHPYGSPCTITTPASTMRVALCENYLDSIESPIEFNDLDNAEMYEFRIVSEDREYIYHSINPWFALNDVAGLDPDFGKEYKISAGIYKDGSESEYSLQCNIYTPIKDVSSADAIKDIFDVKAYPNPFTSECYIDILTTDQGIVEIYVYDAVGRLVEQQKLGDNRQTAIGNGLPAALYNVIIKQGDKKMVVKLIKN